MRWLGYMGVGDKERAYYMRGGDRGDEMGYIYSDIPYHLHCLIPI